MVSKLRKKGHRKEKEEKKERKIQEHSPFFSFLMGCRTLFR